MKKIIMNNVKMVNTIVNGVWRITLPEHRAKRPEWYTPEGWEKKRLKALHREIKQGDNVYYIGAEEGDIAALCQIWGGKLFLFEPNDKVWPNMKAIWEANSLETPSCFSGFASDKTITGGKNLFFNSWPPSADGPVIGDHGFKELWEPGDIPQITIDEYSKWSEAIPDIISLDVEGSEFQVLKGAEDTLKKYRPKIFLSGHPEFMFRMFGQYLYDLRNWIKDIGYTEEILDYQHEVHLLYKPNEEKM